MISDTEAWVKIYNNAFILFLQNSAFLLAQRYQNNSMDYFCLLFLFISMIKAQKAKSRFYKILILYFDHRSAFLGEQADYINRICFT